MKASKAKCRQAIESHHGGFRDAPDTAIMTIWNSLDGETQKRYLEDVDKERKANNAVSDSARTNVRGGSKHRREAPEG